MNIREAAFEDLPQIIKLISDDILGRTREYYSEPLSQVYIDAYNNICGDESNKIFVVCDDDDNSIVTGCFQITFTQYLSRMGGIRATIESVRIDEKKRNLGIGTQMLEYAIAIAKKRNAILIQLTTDKSRVDTKRFYEKIGFKATHEGMKLDLRNK